MNGILRVFGRTLKKYRNAASMTQEDLAVRLGGMSRVSIANYEAGTQAAPFEHVMRLAIMLGFSLDEIMREVKSETFDGTIDRLNPDVRVLLMDAFKSQEVNNGR